MTRTLPALASLALLVFALGARAHPLDYTTVRAAAWLEGAQREDGSWGQDPAVRAIHTTAAVEALGVHGRRREAYWEGRSWLAAHANASVDHASRRAMALALLDGPSAGAADFLADHYRSDSNGRGGWGLFFPHVASVFDTSLALRARAALGQVSSSTSHGAIEFLLASRIGEAGWAFDAIADLRESDPVATAAALRALASVAALHPEVDSHGEAASSWLAAHVGADAPTLVQALAARALLGWDPHSPRADFLLAHLDASQLGEGSWGEDPYTTAVALHAFAARLARDDADRHQVISIPDLGLRAAINGMLDSRNRLDAITRYDLSLLGHLDAAGFGIRILDGIEYAENLFSIDLRDNPALTDLTPLDALPVLQIVTLSETSCDLDDDGRLSAADLLLLARSRMGGLELPASRAARADVAPLLRGDGVLDIRDLLLVMRSYQGLGSACSQ